MRGKPFGTFSKTSFVFSVLKIKRKSEKYGLVGVWI